MKFLCALLITGLLFLGLFSRKAAAQETSWTLAVPPKYFTGIVEKVLEEHLVDPEKQLYTQKLAVRRDDNGQTVELEVGSEFQPLNKAQLLRTGKKVVLSEQHITPEERNVVLADTYRLPAVTWLAVLFVIIVVLVGKTQGLGSLVGMGVSLLVLVKYIVPQILAGTDPILVSLIGAGCIGGLTLYIAHGFHMKSHVALCAMFVALAAVALLAYSSVKGAHLVGLGSEEAYFLQYGDTSNINLQGLLLGGIILGALGVLDDITVSQVSVVFQLRAAKKNISLQELYFRGLEVGKDHVASLVNTLVLVYAGANLPLFILFLINEQTPGWVTLNSEVIVEEIIRTLAGSIGLVLAVPLATMLAAVVASKIPAEKIDKHSMHAH